MAINVGSLYWSAGIRTKELVRDAKTIKSQFGGLSKSGNALSGVFSPKNLGIAGVTTALIGAGKAAYDFSKEYETAFASVRTITNESTDGINTMEQAIIDMTQTIPIGATEGAEALYQIVSAGYDGAEGLQLLEVSARAAVGGITDTATAADGITTILNSYGKEASEASKISDVLFTTVRLGKTTFGELAASISNIAPLAASSGISFEEISAAIATLTKQGVPTAQAITQIRSAVLSTTEVLGDAAFKGRTLQDAFQAVRDSANGSSSALRKSVSSVEALNGVLGLTGDNARTAAEDLEGISASTGAAADAFEVMVETADSQLTLLQNNIKAASKSVGDFLLVNSSDVIKKINRLFEDANVRTAGKAKSIAEEAKGNAEALTDAEERRLSVSQKILELEQERVRLGGEIAKARKNIDDAILPEIFEAPARAFGFTSDQLTPVTNNRAFIEYASEQYDAIKKAQDELEAYFLTIKEGSEDLNAKDAGIEIPIKTPTLGDLKEELKVLQDQLDKVPIEEAPSVNLQIEAKKEEIKKALEVIEKEAGEIALEPIVKVKPSDVRVGDTIGGLESDIKSLQNQKKAAVTFQERASLQAEINVLQVKYNKLLNETNIGLKGAAKNMKDFAKSQPTGKKGIDFGAMANNLFDVTNALDSAANFAGNFNSELADSITTIADVANAAGGIAQGIASGNPLQIIGASFDLLSSITVSAADLQAQAQENFANRITRTNRLIQTQIDLLSNLSGDELTEGRLDAVNTIQNQIDALNAQAEITKAGFKKVEGGGFLGIGKKETQFKIEGFESVEDLKKFYEDDAFQDILDEGFVIKNEGEILDLIDEYEALIETRRELFEDFVGTTSGGIADTIVQGFAEGKYAAEDFASDFEDLMKNAMLQTFKSQYINKATEDFFKNFADATLEGGELSEADINALQQEFNKTIEDAQEGFDALNDIFEGAFGKGIADELDSSVEGLSGSIGRQITEDTATELVGLWTRTSFDTRAILSANQEMVGIQQQIAANTLRVAEGVDLINSRYDSQSTDRDSGNVI